MSAVSGYLTVEQVVDGHWLEGIDLAQERQITGPELA